MKMIHLHIISERFASKYPIPKTSKFNPIMGNFSNKIGFSKLPDSLRKTMFGMSQLEKATSYEVAKLTGRSRSLESFHLNQLERMGYLVKSRTGKKLYFKIFQPYREESAKIEF